MYNIVFWPLQPPVHALYLKMPLRYLWEIWNLDLWINSFFGTIYPCFGTDSALKKSAKCQFFRLKILLKIIFVIKSVNLKIPNVQTQIINFFWFFINESVPNYVGRVDRFWYNVDMFWNCHYWQGLYDKYRKKEQPQETKEIKIFQLLS